MVGCVPSLIAAALATRRPIPVLLVERSRGRVTVVERAQLGEVARAERAAGTGKELSSNLTG